MQCPKCDGTGHIRAYAHIAGGVCFHCNGRGVVAGNGRAIKDILLKHVASPLPGLNKRQTKEVFDLDWHRGSWECTTPDATYDAIVAAGYWQREQRGRLTVYARIDSLKLDWSHIELGA